MTSCWICVATGSTSCSIFPMSLQALSRASSILTALSGTEKAWITSLNTTVEETKGKAQLYSLGFDNFLTYALIGLHNVPCKRHKHVQKDDHKCRHICLHGSLKKVVSHLWFALRWGWVVVLELRPCLQKKRHPFSTTIRVIFIRDIINHQPLSLRPFMWWLSFHAGLLGYCKF